MWSNINSLKYGESSTIPNYNFLCYENTANNIDHIFEIFVQACIQQGNFPQYLDAAII